VKSFGEKLGFLYEELVKWFLKISDFRMGNDVSSVLSGGYKGFNNGLSFGNDWEVLGLN